MLKAVIRVIIWIYIVTFAIGFLACLAIPFDRTSGISIPSAISGAVFCAALSIGLFFLDRKKVAPWTPSGRVTAAIKQASESRERDKQRKHELEMAQLQAWIEESRANSPVSPNHSHDLGMRWRDGQNDLDDEDARKPIRERRDTVYIMEKHEPAVRRFVKMMTGRPYGMIRTTAVLKPEPSNEVDPNAVKVMLNGHAVGYLARGEQDGVAELMRRQKLKELPLEVLVRYVPEGMWIWYFDDEEELEVFARFILDKEKKHFESYPTVGL